MSDPRPKDQASPVRRKVSRKMIVAYIHEDGVYCPRTINQHCPEHEGEDMNDISEGLTLDLNSVPGFPGVGGLGLQAQGGFPGLDGGLGMPGGIPFGYGGPMDGSMGLGGGGMDGLGFPGGLDGLGFPGGLEGLPGMSGQPGEEGAAGFPGLFNGNMGLGGGLPGEFGGLGGPGIPGGLGPGGPGEVGGVPGLGPVNWPYDQATQEQLSGMSPDFGQFQNGE